MTANPVANNNIGLEKTCLSDDIRKVEIETAICPAIHQLEVLASLASARVAAWYVSDWSSFEELSKDSMSRNYVTNVRISGRFVVPCVHWHLTLKGSEIVGCIF